MRKLLKSSLSSALGIGISRILGLVREVLIASLFGVSWKTDAFFLAWKIPNTFRRVLGEGGFNGVMLPELGRLHEENRKKYLSSLFFYISLISLTISVLLSLFAPLIVKLLSHNTDREFINSAITYLRWLSFYLFFASLNAFFMSFLQFKGKYFVSYLSQAVFNLTVIVFIILFHSELGIFSIVYGALVGGFLQVLFVFYFFKKIEGEIYFDFYPYRRVKNFFKNLLPQVGSTGIGHLSTLAEAFFATAVGGGILSSLYYAMRIFQLGVSFVSVSLKNVSLSEISKVKEKDEHTLRESFKLGILLSVPAAIGLFILSEDIVKVIYQHGIFKENNTQRVALFLSVYSLGLIPYTLFEIGKSKLFKEEKYWKAFKCSSVWFLVEVPIAAIGVFLLKLGGVAIAFSYTLGVFVALFVFLLREKIVSIKELFKEIKPKYYLLWFVEAVFLLGLKILLKNPYAVVFIGIPLFGIPYLYILYKER